jgi:hypothetical protein
MIEHRDIAEQAFASTHLPAPPRTVEQALVYITNLLALLPAEERAGYVQGPNGGENVTPLADGTLVRISRVMYPDGQIYKVMSDAPNGNPQWVPEDIRPDLYVPYGGPSVPPDDTVPPEQPGVDPGPILARLAALEAEMVKKADAERVKAINDRLEGVDMLAKSAIKALPEYVGEAGPVRLWGINLGTFTVISRPKP